MRQWGRSQLCALLIWATNKIRRDRGTRRSPWSDSARMRSTGAQPYDPFHNWKGFLVHRSTPERFSAAVRSPRRDRVEFTLRALMRKCRPIPDQELLRALQHQLAALVMNSRAQRHRAGAAAGHELDHLKRWIDGVVGI